MERKIFKIAIIAMLLVCVCATVTNALSFSVTMTPSKKVVPASTEFTVEIKVSNLDVGTNGINTLSGNLIYDDEVFETIGESSIEGRNGWSHSFNPENDGKITLTKMSFVKTDEEVFQVTFKTKSTEELKSNTKGLIQFKGISASNSASDITASDVSVEIKIGEESSEDGDVNVTPSNTTNNTTNNNNNTNTTNTSGGNSIGITPSNTNKNTTNKNTTNTNTNKANTNTNTNKSNTNTNKATNTNTNKAVSPYVNSTNTTNEDIPYAGAEDYILYFIGAVLAIAIVFYIKFERINKEMK